MPPEPEDVEQTVSLAADQAIGAYDQETFSVGGVLLDSSGKVIHGLHNNVVVDKLTFDPTAHGERRLVDWYFKQVAKGITLPPPNQISIVTSLDPCVMCTGSILTAGFNVIVAAFDTQAGINYDKRADFPTLSPELRACAARTFSYPEVGGHTIFRRPASGAPLPSFFKRKVILGQTQALCLSIFLATLGTVRDNISHDLDPVELKDPADLPQNDPIIEALVAIYPKTLHYRAPARSQPDSRLLPYLNEVALKDRQQGGPGQAVALLDYFGNLLICLPGHLAQSPIRTAFMETTRAYAQLRYKLAKQSINGKRVFKYLCHPKYGTLVFLRGPDKSSSSLVDLGAYGSTMEGPLWRRGIPSQFQYVNGTIPPGELTAYCAKLPPLYSKVIKVNPVQSQSINL